jgi:hypothetical protein
MLSGVEAYYGTEFPSIPLRVTAQCDWLIKHYRLIIIHQYPPVQVQ